MCCIKRLAVFRWLTHTGREVPPSGLKKNKQPDLYGRSTTCGSKPGGLLYPLPGSKAPVAKCIVEAERPGGPIHRIQEDVPPSGLGSNGVESGSAQALR
jgi:hypothetical protein